MTPEVEIQQEGAFGRPLIDGRIPVRNVWLLFLYAYDLARFQHRFDAKVEASPDLKSLTLAFSATRLRFAYAAISALVTSVVRSR